jgi:hypothetical protein
MYRLMSICVSVAAALRRLDLTSASSNVAMFVPGINSGP